MKCVHVVVVLLIGCAGGGSPPATTGPTLAAADPPALPTCFQGTSSGAGQRVRTITRRTVDPAARQIVEDVVHDDVGGLKAFHVVMAVDGARFTLTEAGGAFTGTGALTGAPWQWTSWTTTTSSQLGGARLEVESHDELTQTGRIARKQIRKDGAIIATIIDELTTFDCADWDRTRAQLAVPALDDALCDRACRRYATLRFWSAAEPALAALPAAERDAARRARTDELAARLDAGAPSCIAQCRAANNAAQTACLAQAGSLDQLTACDAR